jgi:hypothetical protein
VSKKHGARKRRKKAARKRARARSDAGLLTALADALNACEKRGMAIHLGYGGAIFCRHGVILPPVKKGQRWEARPAPARPDGPALRDWDDD